VHGIAVSGGSFPAEIWRLFMERAVEKLPERDWAVPDELPDWEPWQRGQYALSYDPYAAPETTTETETETEEAAPAEPPPPAVEPE
jgi:hypothetical protein